MKTIHLAIIVFSALGILIVTNPVYAPCLVGVTDCGPPPGVTVSTWTDSQFYEKNDTIDLKGKLYVENYTNPVQVQVVNPTGMAVQTLETFVNNNTFSAKINANFNENGMYQIVTCVKSWCDRSYFKYTGKPYDLSSNGANYPVWYKSVADVDNMSVNTSEDSLLIHLLGAPIGSIFQISLPRNLIDSASANGADSNFTVFAGENPVQKLMSKTNFNETKTSQIARTLKIKIPSYSQIADMQGDMYVKIIGMKTSKISDMVTLSPLQQFKSGTPARNIQCNAGLVLIIKSDDSSPRCVGPETASILIQRGWASEFVLPTNTEINTPCYGIPVSSRDSRTNEIPVLLMQPNSTAKICVEYYFDSDWNSYPNKEIYPYGILETCCFISNAKYSTEPSSRVTVMADPPLFNVTGVHSGTKISVVYTIRTGSNSTGFYDNSVPYGSCMSYPMAIGYAASQVDKSHFSKWIAVIPPCFYSIDGVDSVKIISGMNYTMVDFS